MALEGSIKDFGVADILQLISQQQKTGVLLVERHDVAVEIYFSAGAIIETKSSEQTARLGELLVKSGMVAADVLKRKMTRAQETFEPIGPVLLREGLLRKEDLERIFLTQIYETFYTILQWREGTYRFIPQNVKPDPHAPDVPGLESILLDVLRMIDEWPDIQAAIHSFANVFGVVPGATDENLDEDEAVVFHVIDGKKTVREIIDCSIAGRFATCKIIVGLLEQGRIRMIGERTDTGRVGVLNKRRVAAVCSYAVLTVVLLAVLSAPTGFPRSVLPFLISEHVRGSSVAQYCVHAAVQKATVALDLYFLQYNRYPDAFEELERAGMLTRRDIDDLVATHGVVYARQGASYTLAPSPGL